MNGADAGRGTFAEEPRSDAPKPSVFAAVDQKMIIDHLDDVQDDDLSSSFFSHSIQDVEDARLAVASDAQGALLPACRQSNSGAALMAHAVSLTLSGARPNYRMQFGKGSP